MPAGNNPPAESHVERLFLALWPPADVRDEMASIVQQLSPEGGRLIAPANLHMTLAFLGDCDAARRACIENAAESAAAPAFNVRLVEAQWRRRGGMVWLAAPDVPKSLTSLVVSLNRALVACGHMPDSRPFRAHVTVARNVRHLRRQAAGVLVEWPVREYCLAASMLTSRGSNYTVVRRWPLRADPTASGSDG